MNKRSPLNVPPYKLRPVAHSFFGDGSPGPFADATWQGKPPRQSDRLLLPVAYQPGFGQAYSGSDPAGPSRSAWEPAQFWGKYNTPIDLPRFVLFCSGAAGNGYYSYLDDLGADLQKHRVGLDDTVLIGNGSPLAVASFPDSATTGTDAGTGVTYPALTVVPAKFTGGDLLVFAGPSFNEYQSGYATVVFDSGGNPSLRAVQGWIDSDCAAVAAAAPRFRNYRVVLTCSDYMGVDGPSGVVNVAGQEQAILESVVTQLVGLGVDAVYGGTFHVTPPAYSTGADLVALVEGAIKDFYGF